jgi:glycosyltransferase involved in cell wall biosynthesis
MAVMALIWPKKGQLALTVFDPVRFEDFIWRRLFSKTLPVNDFATVTTQEFRICSQPWHLLHMAGLTTLKMVSQAIYPLLDTRSIDVFIAQTPFPGRVVANTRLVVRYHDAFPILMPHTIANASRHEATHYHALRCNVQSGAYFSCVSETSRQDLIQLYPELENRSVTIYNMVSHEFFVEQSRRERVDNIVRSRINLLPSKKDSHDHTNEDGFQYLLIVSTIEPRKNHELLLSAWEILRSEVDPTLKLVVVGNEGWNSESVVGKMKFWAELGEIIPLNNLPASDLRVLYRHALATVCPSLAEGFDFAGVEAMCSGGLVIASDIPVHKEIYADAAEYFHPYSVPDMVGSIKKVLFSPDSEMRQNQLRLNAKAVSERFKSETILPKWQSFLQMIAGI